MRAFRDIFPRKFTASRFASTLVIAEHDGGKNLTAGTLSTINAASKIGGDISVLVLGKNVSQAAIHASRVNNVSKVLTVDSDIFSHPVAEDTAEVVRTVASNFSHILAPATNSAKNFLPRAAALLDISPVTDVISIEDESTFKRPVYAGNAIATVKATAAKKILLIRTTAFDKASESESNAATIEPLSLTSTKSTKSNFVSENVSKSDRPDLSNARVVVSGGRGLKSGENFVLLEKLADKLGGAVGASRAAVDAGYVPNEYQIGQTGKVVAPDLYIAVGISGAIQHLSGMKDSKTIVAINKDKEAPIFQVADYGLVEDLFKAVPEMESKL